MSRHHASDFSASEESISFEEAASASASSEEGHLADYRAFMLGTPLECDARSEKKQRKRMAKAEAMQQQLTSQGCADCRTIGFACPACQAKRKRKKEEEERGSYNSMPILYQRSNTLQGMLKTDLPAPSMVAVTATTPVNNTKTISSAVSATPLSSQAATINKPLPKLVYFGAQTPTTKTPLNNNTKPVSTPLEKKVTLNTQQSSPVSKPLEKKSIPVSNPLPQMVNVRPKGMPQQQQVTTTSLDALRLDRMSLQFKESQKIANPVIQSLMQNPYKSTVQMPLSCHTGEQMRVVQCHMRTCHSEYFSLLEQNGLLDEMQAQMALDDTICFLFVIPVNSVLVTLSEAISPETARTLRFHVIKIQQGQTFDSLEGRTLLPTLMDKDLEVEKRGDERYVGGYQAMSDQFYPDHIVHIRGLLDASDENTENPIVEEAVVDETIVQKEGGGDENENTTTSSSTTGTSVPEEDEASTSDLELPPPMDANTVVDDGTTTEPPTDLPPTLPEEGTQQLLHTQSRLTAVNKSCLLLHSSLPRVIERMNMSYYNGKIDLDAHRTAIPKTRAVLLTLRTYNTQSLWQRCLQVQLPDIARLKAQRHVQQHYQEVPHFTMEDGTRLTEYEWRGPTVTLSELSQGLCEVSFGNPLGEKAEGTTRILCKLQQPLQKQQKPLTFMTDNENVLIRFSAQGQLTTVLINHNHAMTQSIELNEMPQSRRHFFELFLDETTRQRFNRNLTKLDFDALLLQEGTLSKYTRKAKKYVKNKTSNALNRAKAQGKKQLAMKLTAVPRPESLASLWKETKGAQSGKKVNVRIYDRQMRMRDLESQSDLSATRYAGGLQVWYQLQDDNNLFDQLQRTENYYVELDVDQWRNLTFNAAMITGGFQLYYATGTGDDVYVLMFEGHSLRAVAKISRHSALYKLMK